jgi:hypothetical protein
MELVEVHPNEPNVEDSTLNDVEQGYYCPRLVDHLELRSLDVSTSSSLKIEMRLGAFGGLEALHDVGIHLFFPFTKLGISQKNAKSSDFSNYKFQEIINTSSFANEPLHLDLVLQKIPRILSLVNVKCQDNVDTSSFPKGDV